jgi:hypothetical protein
MAPPTGRFWPRKSPKSTEPFPQKGRYNKEDHVLQKRLSPVEFRRLHPVFNRASHSFERTSKKFIDADAHSAIQNVHQHPIWKNQHYSHRSHRPCLTTEARSSASSPGITPRKTPPPDSTTNWKWDRLPVGSMLGFSSLGFRGPLVFHHRWIPLTFTESRNVS